MKTPSQSQPVSVGPYHPEGRVVQILRADETLTEPVPFSSQGAFAQFVDRVRALTDLSPEADRVHWADRPGEWPED